MCCSALQAAELEIEWGGVGTCFRVIYFFVFLNSTMCQATKLQLKATVAKVLQAIQRSERYVYIYIYIILHRTT